MADMMTFPNTVEEFMEQYKITDTEQIYTNGAELVPIFRMKQWFDHEPERKKGKWIIDKDCEGKSRTITCNLCGHKEFNWHNPNYCENCGADMRGDEDDTD